MVWAPAVNDPAYRAAVWDPHARVDAYVEVIGADGATLERIGGNPNRPGALKGQVNLRGDEHVRFTASVTIADDELVPHQPGDLLHLWSWNRLRVWHGICVDEESDSWHWVPLGTGFITADDPTDDGAPVVELELRVADAASVIKHALMEMSVEVGGLTVDAAVRDILTDAAPWATLRLEQSDHRLPADYEAGEPDADPWEVCADLAAVAGMRLFVDRMGDVVLEHDRDAATVRAQFVEGEFCKATAATARRNLADVKNVVTVSTGAMKDPDGNELEPLSVTVVDDDPSSPTRVGEGTEMRPVLRHPEIVADEATTEAQLREIARAKLAELTATTTVCEVDHFPHAHLDPGDAVEVGFGRLGVAGVQRIQSVSLALGATGWQTTVTEGRR